MKSNLAFIIAGDGAINAVVNNTDRYVLPKSSPFYPAAKAALKLGNAKLFVEQCDLDKGLRTRSNGKVTLDQGVIKWNGAPVHNSLTKRIYALMADDFPFDSLLLFLENTLKNPSRQAVDELYLFLEANELPITEDGCFLAYKRVKDDYTSIHGTGPDRKPFYHKPGDTPKMKREDCDPDRDQTCSRGLHFCSTGYLPSYGGARTVILKVNPANVVSIPSDYHNQKGRACEYLVVGEHRDNDNRDVLTEAAVYTTTPVTEDCPLGVKPSGQKFHNKRGTNGKFVAKGS